MVFRNVYGVFEEGFARACNRLFTSTRLRRMVKGMNYKQLNKAFFFVTVFLNRSTE